MFRYIIMMGFFVSSLISFKVEAGIGDYLSKVADWWQSKSVDPYTSQIGDSPQKTGTVPLVSQTDKPATNNVPGMCVVPREPARTVCEAGSGFLCVDTPPGSVASDFVEVKGTIDIKGSAPASIKIVAQNEYTKRSVLVDTAKFKMGCELKVSKDEPFCLASDGRFLAYVSLPEKGPYTISVSASRLVGKSMEKSVRTTSANPLKLSAENISLSPDVKKEAAVDADTIFVTADLLGKCTYCDFIGAQTGGVLVSVDNVIYESNGGVKHITCKSTVEQGGQGRFIIGVPVGAGKNTLTVSACNAALGGACPKVGGITFTSKVRSSNFEILTPAPAPAYDANEFPLVNFSFLLGENKECVNMAFNRNAPLEVCPKDGKYFAELKPKVGINVASISYKDQPEEFSWTFGWGKIESPYLGKTKRVEVSHSVALAIPAETLTKSIVPFVDNFLRSDELGALLKKITAKGPTVDEGGEGESAPSGIQIPKCAAGDSSSNFNISLRGEPKIGKGAIRTFNIGENKINFKLALDDVKLGVNLIIGKGKSPLPLLIAFRKLVIEAGLSFEKDKSGKNLILITTPNNDCSFKSKAYCQGKPAVVIPQNFIGGASALGRFVTCEESEAASDVLDTCRALNAIDAITGQVHETLLDAINNGAYCGGSEMLTKLVRQGLEFSDISFGSGGLIPKMNFPLTVWVEDGFSVGENGIRADVGIAAGNDKYFSLADEKFHLPSVGIIKDGKGIVTSSSSLDLAKDINMALSFDALNAVLFALTTYGDGRAARGMLDVDIDELTFTNAGFDFVKECDAFLPVPKVKETPPILCFIRPRVGELLGTALSTYGYFEAKQPVMLSLTGNRALSPRVSVAILTDLPVVDTGEKNTGKKVEDVPTGQLMALELGGVRMSFYALQIDENAGKDAYGNLAIKKDASGTPIIRSMRPEDPDPKNGAIVSFDLSLLLGIEVSKVHEDPADASRNIITVRTLADRSRLVITPIAGSNATTVPATGIISALSEKLKLAIKSFSTPDQAIKIPVPKEMKFGDGETELGPLGLAAINFGANGFELTLDAKQNAIKLAIDAILTQILHENGKLVTNKIPN